MWSLRTSQCSGEKHLGNVQVPSLVIQSMADTGVFPSDAEQIYAHLGTEKKEIQFMDGDHYLTEPNKARDEVADRIAAWTQQKY